MNDASQIVPGLLQGREPEQATGLFVHTIVLCWREREAGWDRFEGIETLMVVRAPMDDDQRTLKPSDVVVAESTAGVVAKELLASRTVLVTCGLGMNRSGLVSALALRRFLNCTGAHAARLVRAARPGALFNPAFLAYVEGLAAP